MSRWIRQRVAWRSLRTPKPHRCNRRRWHTYHLVNSGIGWADLHCIRCGRQTEIRCLSTEAHVALLDAFVEEQT